MIFKDKKEYPFRKGLKLFIAVELVMLTTTYGLYASCNRSQAARKYFYDSPYLGFIVEYYYKVGEAYGTKTVRAYDQAVWSAEKK